MIKHFLQETVHSGLSLKELRIFNMTGSGHRLTTVEEVDEKLIQLAKDVLDQEKRPLIY